MYLTVTNIPTYAIFVAINFGCGVRVSKGMENCEYEECVFTGYTCKNNKCVCDPDEPPFFRCTPPRSHGELCSTDQECQLSDYNLYCVKSDMKICKCKRNYAWDSERKKCFPRLDDNIYIGRFDPVRDLVIPAIIIVTISAMVYLGFKLFCNCGKLWRRRRHQEVTRELEEISATPHQQATWIASYRVFSPYSNTARPPPGLFVPSQLSMSPPSYEEALKHKVILSSYQPMGTPPASVPAYTFPPSDSSRQYQTLPANSSSSSSAFILNPNGPTPSAIRISTMSGHRSLPISQTDTYPGISSSRDPMRSQPIYSGTTGQMWSTHHPSSLPRTNPEAQSIENGEVVHSRSSHASDAWQVPQQQNRSSQQPISIAQQIESQSHASTFRPTQPARIYQGVTSDLIRNVQTNNEIIR